jgi:hypothetical protein
VFVVVHARVFLAKKKKQKSFCFFSSQHHQKKKVFRAFPLIVSSSSNQRLLLIMLMSECSLSSLGVAIIKRPSLYVAIRPKNSVDLIKSSEWEIKKLINDLLNKEIPPISYHVEMNSRSIFVELVFDNENSRQALVLRLQPSCTQVIRSTTVSVTVQLQEHGESRKHHEDDMVEYLAERDKKWEKNRSIWIRFLPAKILELHRAADSGDDTSAELTQGHPLWILIDQLAGVLEGGVSAVEVIEVLPSTEGAGVAAALLATVCVKFTSFDKCKEIAAALGYFHDNTVYNTTVALIQHLVTKKVFRFDVLPDIDDNYLGVHHRMQRTAKREKIQRLRVDLQSLLSSVSTDISEHMHEDAQKKYDTFMLEHTETEGEGGGGGGTVPALMRDLEESLADLRQLVVHVAAAQPANQLQLQLLPSGGQTHLPASFVLASGISEDTLRQTLVGVKKAVGVVKSRHVLLEKTMREVMQQRDDREELHRLKNKTTDMFSVVTSSSKVYSNLNADCDQALTACEQLQQTYDSMQTARFDFISHAKSKMQAVRSQLSMLHKLLEKQARVNVNIQKINFDRALSTRCEPEGGEEEGEEGDGRGGEISDIAKIRECVGHGERNATALETCCAMIQKEVNKQKLESFFRTITIFTRLAEELLNSFNIAVNALVDAEGDSCQVATADILVQIRELILSFVTQNICGYFSTLNEYLSRTYSVSSLKLLCHQVSAISSVTERVCGPLSRAEGALGERKRQVEASKRRCQAKEKSRDSIIDMIIPEDPSELQAQLSRAREQSKVMTDLFQPAISSTEYRLARLQGLLFGQIAKDISFVSVLLNEEDFEGGSDEEAGLRFDNLSGTVQAFLNGSTLGVITADLDASAEQYEMLLMTREDELSSDLRAQLLEQQRLERESLLKEEKRRFLLQKIQRLQREKEQLEIEERKKENRERERERERERGQQKKRKGRDDNIKINNNNSSPSTSSNISRHAKRSGSNYNNSSSSSSSAGNSNKRQRGGRDHVISDGQQKRSFDIKKFMARDDNGRDQQKTSKVKSEHPSKMATQLPVSSLAQTTVHSGNGSGSGSSSKGAIAMVPNDPDRECRSLREVLLRKKLLAASRSAAM